MRIGVLALWFRKINCVHITFGWAVTLAAYAVCYTLSKACHARTWPILPSHGLQGERSQSYSSCAGCYRGGPGSNPVQPMECCTARRHLHHRGAPVEAMFGGIHAKSLYHPILGLYRPFELVPPGLNRKASFLQGVGLKRKAPFLLHEFVSLHMAQVPRNRRSIVPSRTVQGSFCESAPQRYE